MEEWWANGVPLEIRQECAKRQEEESHRKLQKEAYLDLIDLKKIIYRNWRFFQSYFVAIGEKRGKDGALGWIDKLNEIRRFLAHPLKAHIAGCTLRDSEVHSLTEADSMALSLLNSFRKISAPN